MSDPWISNPTVQDALYRRMTGQPKHWLNWLFEDYLSTKPSRVLSLCCGEGDHEVVMAKANYADTVIGVDGEPSKIELAQGKSKDLPAEFIHQRIEDFVANYDGEKFDLILADNALDRVPDIEGFTRQLRELLKPDGRLCVLEYVGPPRHVYSPLQVSIINRFVDALPSDMRLDGDARFPNYPSWSGQGDPVGKRARPQVVVSVLESYLKPEKVSNCAGGLLEPVFSCLNSGALSSNNVQNEAMVRLLIAADETLTQSGLFKHSLMFGIYALR